MKTFLVTIQVDDPYPKKFEYRETASNIGTAINRAVKRFRTEHWRGRPLKSLGVRAVML